jgi:hypothetical protein
MQKGPHWGSGAIHGNVEIASTDGDGSISVELEHRAFQSGFQGRGRRVISKERIREPEREGVHGAGGRHADVPQPGAAREVLDCCHYARMNDLKGHIICMRATAPAGLLVTSSKS